jgi:hypothetical protein
MWEETQSLAELICTDSSWRDYVVIATTLTGTTTTTTTIIIMMTAINIYTHNILQNTHVTLIGLYKSKDKNVLSFIKHQAMKTNGGMEV